MLRILALAFCFLLSAASPSHAFDACSADAEAGYKPIEETYSQGLLFRISKCGVPDSYMFGTYHSNNETMWSNAQTVLASLGGSRLAVFEITEEITPATVQSFMFFPEASQENLQTLLGDKDFNTLYAKMQATDPMPLDALKRMRPWAASLILQMPKETGDKPVLDDRLKAVATEKNIPLAPLETLHEQFDIFMQLSNPEQLTLLRETLSTLPQINALTQQIEQAYLARDLRMLGQLADAGFRMMLDLALKEKLIASLITARNEIMTDRMIPYLGKGGTFIAIGALHLMGPGGILGKLEKQGYYITPM